MSGIVQDVRQALRAVSRAPWLSAVVVATLGLGIGSNAVLFSVVNAILIEPLGHREPERLVYLRPGLPGQGVAEVMLAPGVLDEVRRSSRTLSEAAGIASVRQNLTGGEYPVQVRVGWCSPNLFGLLGARTQLGRGMRADEGTGSLVLSDAFWRSHFAGDPGVVGRGMQLDGYAYTIVGVLEPAFRLELPRGHREFDVLKSPDAWWQNGSIWDPKDLENGILRGVARLADGASLEQANAELAALAARLRERNAALAAGAYSLRAEPLKEATTGGARTSLLVLWGAVSCLLLVACANVTNLLLARGQARAGELAVRLAMGASRGRLLRLLLCESLLLALLGGALGVALADGGLALFHALRPAGLPRGASVRLDGDSLAFALALSLGCTLLCGLWPALLAVRRDVTGDLHSGRSTLDPRRRRASAALVVSQVAVSLVLLVGGSLLATSLARLTAVAPGFASEGALTFSVSLPGTRYQRPLGTDRFLRSLEDAIRTLPGVRGVGSVWPLPLSGLNWGGSVEARGGSEWKEPAADYRLATPALFEALGTPLVAGRSFASEDPRQVVVVSRALAERAWPGESAVGRVLRANPWGGSPAEFSVVGVVGDVRFRSLRQPPKETVYFDSRGWSWTDWETSLVVRASGDPRRLVEPIRAEIARLDPQVPMAEVRTLGEYVADDVATPRFALALLGAAALVSLVMSVVGLYGVVAYGVGRRAREIGIRMALGASREQIVAMVLGQGARLAAAGVALGCGLSFLGTRVLEGLLFGVSASDPWLVAVVAGGLLATALLACAVPARNAAGLDPVRTLRAD